MNFFDHQRAAKGTTLKLVFLFVLAVVAIVVVIDGTVAVYLWAENSDTSVILVVVGFLTVFTLLLIAGGMITKTFKLRQGGSAVAAAVGAVPVDPTTTDPQLRRYVNVVEEMALASGVPAPRLFVMQKEPGINAFAAGYTPADAAIAVTGGALAHLNRDELQGVIGHEFSHILNGDMRLNVRLIGLLAGILVVGYTGLRIADVGGRAGEKNPILIVGLVMWVFGFVGVFFGGLIKAAVSRQREWLADASAVQFTRQTTGLAGALRKIGGIPTGSALRDSRGAQVSHMLFGEGKRPRRLFARLSALSATHPSLPERIKALDPSFDPQVLDELQRHYSQQPPNGLAEDVAAGFAPAGDLGAAAGRRGVSPEHVAARAGTLTPADLKWGAAMRARLPADVHSLGAQPSTAPAATIALLLAPPGDPLHARQLDAVAHRLGQAQADAAAALAGVMTNLPREFRLPFVELALPQLAVHPRDYQKTLVAALEELAAADDTVTMFEYCVTRLIWSHLQDAADPSHRSKVGKGSLGAIRPLVTTLLATMAAAGARDQEAASRALNAAVSRLYGDADATQEPRRRSWQQTLDQGWAALDGLEPRAKQALVEAMVVAVLDDGEVAALEAELLRAACGLMHVPLPALLA